MSQNLSAYGDGPRIVISADKKMCSGDTCNTAALNLPNHFGTHIDFPRHFCIDGMDGSKFGPETFIFKKIQYLNLGSASSNKDKIFAQVDFDNFNLNSDTEILLLDFGFWRIRNQPEYLFKNPGLHPDLGMYLKKKLPALRMIVLDSISLNPWNNKEIGREAHRKFLVDHQILIVEDADYSSIPVNAIFRNLIVAPFRYDNADGAPVTIMAEVT